MLVSMWLQPMVLLVLFQFLFHPVLWIDHPVAAPLSSAVFCVTFTREPQSEVEFIRIA